MIAADDEILFIPCPDDGRIRWLSVDDFSDPSEREITSEQIHLTFFRHADPGEPTQFMEVAEGCLRLSVTSARMLVRQLKEAIRRRESTP